MFEREHDRWCSRSNTRRAGDYAARSDGLTDWAVIEWLNGRCW
ncbi:hypothetical protein A7982_13615 [Minicystis rosea]|nr:hypothetical protein A7982_13615 [Minicystis rosea]